MSRPDQSFYLAHFTKNGKDYEPGTITDPLENDKMSARDRLISILKDKRIKSSTVSWTAQKVVCFTECPWGSLLQHARVYSPYGIGFTKKLVYSRGGNPVFYVNPNLFNIERWNPSVYPFITPFVPRYASNKIKNQRPFNGKYIDYSHEREWRVAKDFSFQYSYIQFLVLDSYEDLNFIPNDIIEQIGSEKIIFMKTYRKIEELWPTHLID